MVSVVPRLRARTTAARGDRLLVVAVVLALCLLPTAGVAAAQDEAITAEAFDVEETFRISISPVGNVLYKNVLVYDREFFDAQSANFEEYPFLLSRRYRAMEDVNEIQDFRADLDKAEATVTLTFRETGRAYNMGDHWIMYGFHTGPAAVDGREMIIEEKSTVNSDYTLWQDLDFKTTTVVSFPQGAEGILWDEEEAAVVWEMPAQLAALTAGGDALQNDRPVFVTLFAVLMAGSLSAAAVVSARGRRTAAATPAAGGSGGPTAANGTYAPVTDAAPAATKAGEPASGPATMDVDEAAPVSGVSRERPHFCRYCGVHLPDADCRFCPDCGRELRPG